MARPTLPNRRNADGSLTAEYRAWQHMRQRCGNPRVRIYPRYGGRGIRVCDEWQHDFDAFFAHIGKRPSSGHSINRINNDGHYEPGNVEWATSQEQNRNTSQNRYVEGRLLVEVAESLNTSTTAIARRIDILGWSNEKAATTATRSWKHRLLEFDGRSQSAQAWARELGISNNTIRGRLAAGWTTAQALTVRPALGNRIVGRTPNE